jgi:hypothetical protein
MKVDIVTAQSLPVLRDRVNSLNDDWRPEGGPFEDKSRGVWCWALICDREPVAPGGVRLREPVRPPKR